MQATADQMAMALDIVRLRAIKRRLRTFAVVGLRRRLTAHEADVFDSLTRERASIVARLTTDSTKGGE